MHMCRGAAEYTVTPCIEINLADLISQGIYAEKSQGAEPGKCRALDFSNVHTRQVFVQLLIAFDRLADIACHVLAACVPLSSLRLVETAFFGHPCAR